MAISALLTDFTGFADEVSGLTRSALLMLVALGACDSVAAAPTDHDDAPFEVVAFSSTHVRVDIGADRSRAQLLRRATILTAAGPVPATLVRARKTCVWLCGEGEEDSRECHYEAILRASALAARPLAVLAGTQAVTSVSAIPASPERTIESEQRWLDATPFGSDPEGYRWRRFPDGVFMARPGALGRDFYAPPIALGHCTQHAIGPFTLLTCGGDAEFLYDGSLAIAFSLGEYTTARARPTLRFTLNGTDAVLMRLGIKGQEIAALLIRDGSRWRLAGRAADYALLC
jgi:hypothetical protein